MIICVKLQNNNTLLCKCEISFEKLIKGDKHQIPNDRFQHEIKLVLSLELSI